MSRPEISQPFTEPLGVPADEHESVGKAALFRSRNLARSSGWSAGAHGGQAPPDGLSADRRPGIVRWLQAPFFAMQFLTVVPSVVARRPPAADDFGRSDSFFPLVGLVLGGLLAGADLLLRPYVATLVLDVLLVALLAGLTGGLHLDGVIDTFDGIFAGRDREQRLAIMRDPRAGSYGVVAVVLILACKLAALASLPTSMRTTALILAPCLGRWGIVLATYAFAYARPEGMGRSFKESIRLQHLIVAGAITIGAAGPLGGVVGLVLWTLVGWFVLLGARGIAAQIGGLTGDSYGAICELTEAGVLVALGLRIGGMVG